MNTKFIIKEIKATHLKLLAILAFTVAFTVDGYAQSRFPAIKISEPERKQKTVAPPDTAGMDERPYFLLIDQCEEALKERDYENAGLRLIEAMAVEPDNPMNPALLSNLGMIYFYEGRDSMSLIALDLAISRAPRMVAARENRATVLRALRRDKEALAEYANILELDSVNTGALFYHGMMSLYGGDLASATRDMERLNAIVPVWSNARLLTATIYSMTGKNHEAASIYRKLIEHERLPEYYGALAGCLIAVDNLSEASEVISDGLKLYVRDPELYYYRALLNYRRFMDRDAKADAEQAIEMGASPKKVQQIFTSPR